MRLPAGLEKSQHGFFPLCSTDRVTSYYSSTDCSKKNVLQIVLHVSEINFNAAFSRPKEGSPRAPAERSSSGGVASERLARLGDVLAHGAVAFVVDDAVALRLPGAAKIAPPGRLAIVAHVPDPRQRPGAHGCGGHESSLEAGLVERHLRLGTEGGVLPSLWHVSAEMVDEAKLRRVSGIEASRGRDEQERLQPHRERVIIDVLCQLCTFAQNRRARVRVLTLASVLPVSTAAIS